MKTLGWLHGRSRILAGAGVVTAGAVAVATLAFTYQGYPTTETHLNDGSVWVTNESSLMVGHFNDQSRVLDGGLRTTSDDYDVLQSGQTVLLHDRLADTVQVVDPDQVALAGSATLPADATVALGGRTVAILNPANGALWVQPAAAVGGFRAASKPAATLGAGTAVTVGQDGTVYAVSPTRGTITTMTADAQGEPAQPVTATMAGLSRDAHVTVTAVGDTAVVLDAATGTLRSTSGLDRRIPDAEGAVLQQPSAVHSAVTVATASALLEVPLDGSAPSSTAARGHGTPAAPVWLNGCAYGAWAGSGRFVRECAGGTHSLVTAVPGATQKAQLRFRQNRDVVVLNDVADGVTWVAGDRMQRVDDWDDLTPPEKGDQQDDTDTVTTTQTVQSTLPRRTSHNTPPVANPDDYGVRPGRITILPVLSNDTDADGDVLTVSVTDAKTRLGDLQVIDNGSGLQIAVPANASGSETFTYRVDDGRGGRAEAAVHVRVHPWSVNEAPKQTRVTQLTMEAGGTISYNILPDWIDPDGDDLFLKTATAAPGDQVETAGDGRLTYRATSGTLGRKDVTVFVSDGTKITEGVVRIDVRPQGTTKPVATADHVIAHAGRPVTVSPLMNDYSAGTQQLRLARVGQASGARITPDYGSGTFSFVAQTPGTYYVQYLVAAGTATADGLVRVDVEPPAAADLPPVAVRDVALLPVGGDTLVNVLANDSDPAGGVLVVESVQVPPDAGVSVAVLGHSTLRVTDLGALSHQTAFTYTVSNGMRSAIGQVVVIPLPAPSVVRPPVARDDTAVVRAGDVVTIPVLDNDSDPNGGVLHVEPQLVAPLPKPAQGVAFVSQNTVRFKAGKTPGTAHVTYQVVNASGQKDAAYVTIQILPVDPKTDQAPQPKDLTARVLSGGQVRIPVPLSGIDPDGDSVTLQGIASAPHKGRVTATGPDWIDYQAVGDATGTDRFTYRVTDTFGAQATGVIRVGIAPASGVNHPPYAVKDTVTVRPGRTVAVPVMANDSDPDGDTIGLVPGGLTVPKIAGLSAAVSGDQVLVTAPNHPLQTSLQYTIRDARGAGAVGVLQVAVKKDVPLLPPVAHDDYVQPAQIKNGTATVDVRANDADPDGTPTDLTVTLPQDGAAMQPGGRVKVTVADHEQLILYTVTDPDGLASSAVIHVPASSSLPPTLRSTKAVTVKSGQTVTLPLRDYVDSPTGGVVITEASTVSALHDNGAGLIKDQRTLVYTPAKGYFGPDALTFEVTTGSGPDDPHGVKATLVLPVTVLPAENQPPTFTTGQVDVAPGEQPATLDLRALTTDPDAADLPRERYTVSGAPHGITARVDGQTLRVSAAASTPKGTAATLHITVNDGHNPPVAGDVTVTVTASTRPLPVAGDVDVPTAHQGKTVTVDVLSHDFNPFPEKPLRITAVTVESGSGSAEVAGSRVAVTPDASFVGRMVVRYTVQDATGDPDRQVDGRIRVTVQGVPAAPGVPVVSSVQDRTVVLGWAPPVDNGAPITKYTVTAVGGGYTRTCQATTCTLSGLTNNVVYNFTVTATNAVGESPASPPSQDARPDARPDTPQAPTLVYGDRSLNVSWATPATPGSPVQSYNLEISPAPPSGVASKTKVTGNALTWSGLENGTAYQVRVQAVNLAPEPSTWSAWSPSVIPARAPDAPGAPSTSMLAPVGSQAQMRVSWNAPSDNGDTIAAYQLAVINGSSVVQTLDVPGGQTSQAVRVATSTTGYTYKVRARNKAGWGAWGAVSAPRRGVVTPGAPGTPQVTPHDGQLAVSFAAAAGNGATSGEIRYQYSLNGGGWQGSWSGTSGTVTGLSNGTSYTVRVRASSTVDGATYDGAASAASASAVPYGKPGAPTVSASASGLSITYSWKAPASNGRAIKNVMVQIDGGGWAAKPTSGSMTVTGYGYSQTHAVHARAVDTAGQTGPTASASATTVAPPPPPPVSASVTKGSQQSRDGCSGPYCHNVILNWANFPSGTYNVQCGNSEVGGDFSRVQSIPMGGTGSRQLDCISGGKPGTHVWVDISGWGRAQYAVW